MAKRDKDAAELPLDDSSEPTVDRVTTAVQPVSTQVVETGGPAHATALDMIRQMATDPNVDPAKLREMLAVKREWEADEARKAFSASLSAFQAEAPIIDKGDDAHGKAYARMDRIWRAVRPLMEKHGLHISWTSCTLDGTIIKLRGTLGHRDGHGQDLAYDLPLPNLITGQNVSQQMGSATSYAKRYCTCDALNIVTGDDDDGNAAGAGETLTDAQVHQLEKEIARTGTELPRFLKFAESDSLQAIHAAVFSMLIKTLKAKADAKTGGAA